MYKYDTHVHTAPVSKCARATVRETVEFYKELDYDGIFITNHFLDSNINIDKSLPYDVKLEFFMSDYHEAVKVGKEVGLKIFFGTELMYKGTDFLVYGLDEDWYFAHPEIMEMERKEELKLMRDSGGLVVHAHPFREADYIGHIRLFPQSVQGVEIINAARKDHENKMAGIYAEEYNFYRTAGSDNHVAYYARMLAGMMSETPIVDEQDFIKRVCEGSMRIFHYPNPICRPWPTR